MHLEVVCNNLQDFSLKKELCQIGTLATCFESILDTFNLQPGAYTLNQIRYDLRKLKTHGIIERAVKTYSYCLTEQGQRTALLLTLFARRVYGLICGSVIQHRPDPLHAPKSVRSI